MSKDQKLARRLCCTSSDRTDSSDAPNARHPSIAAHNPRLLPRSQPENWEAMKSLTPSDVRELRQYVPMMQAPSGFDRSSQLSASGKRLPVSKLIYRIKERFSKYSTSPTKSPIKITFRPPKISLKKDPSVEPDSRGLDLLNEDGDLLGSFDADARPLNDALLERVGDCSPTNLSCSQPSRASYILKDGGVETSATLSFTVESLSAASSSFDQSSSNQTRETAPEGIIGPILTSKLGTFSFESDRQSRRARQTSQNSDIAKAAKALFDTLSSGSLLHSSTTNRESLELYDRSNARSESQYPSALRGRCRCPDDPLNSANEEVRNKADADVDDHNEESPKSSIHLYNMRISQHLRSMSNLSAEYSTVGFSKESKYNRKFSGDCVSESNGPRSKAQPTNEARMLSSNLTSRSSGEFVEDMTCCHDQSSHRPSLEDSVVELSCPVPYKSEIVSSGDSLIPQINDSIAAFPTKRLLLRRGSKAYAHYYAHFSTPHTLARMSLIETRLGAHQNYEHSFNNLGLGRNIEDEAQDNVYSGQHVEHVQRGFDGPSDQSLAPDVLVTEPSYTQSESVGSNYDMTSAVWEKALRAHQDNYFDSQRKRGSSTSNGSRKSSHHSRDSNEGCKNRQESLLEPERRASIALKRVNTSLSFDLLTVPGKGSVTQPPSPVKADNPECFATGRLSVDGRVRSVSQPPPNIGSAESDVSQANQLLVPGGNIYGQPIPRITLTDPQSSKSVLRSSPRKLTGLKSWSRFPSHTRKERNASAGITDDVLTRDFQTDHLCSTEELKNATRTNQIWFGGKSKWRTRTMVLRGKFLTDLTALFKSRTNGGFRRREHGHRSSISVGGTLEYPELELLPLSEPTVSTARDLHMGILASSHSAPASYDSRTRPDVRACSNYRSLGRFESSDYGSNSGHIHDTADGSSDGLSANKWADIYGQLIPRGTHRSSGSVPPFDGSYGSFPFSRPTSPGAMSLPPTLQNKVVGRVKNLEVRAASVQAMRRSTQDLCAMLEEGESAELARALKAAEEAFAE